MLLAMAPSKRFRDIKTAPRDGNRGGSEEIVRAYWAAQHQAFVGEDHPHRKTLHQVTGWREIAR